MLGWLEQITYKNGDIPLLNDSTNGIAPSSLELFEYAKRLNLNIKKVEMSASGYRKFTKEKHECILDIGDIGAEYIPGHAHADTFSFELKLESKPFIVDTGLSTYESNERRTLERSTVSHNTVEVNGENQSDVWGGFRVANRANIVFLAENEHSVKATHDGYRKENILHTRKWSFNQNSIIIEDSMSKECNAIARIHFHPLVTQKEIIKYINLTKLNYTFKTYKYSSAFNQYTLGIMLEIYFTRALTVKIEF